VNAARFHSDPFVPGIRNNGLFTALTEEVSSAKLSWSRLLLKSNGQIHWPTPWAWDVERRDLLKKAASGVPCLRRSGFTSTRWSASTRKRAGRSPFSRAHVLSVRSVRKNGCGLAGRTLREDSGHAFLNRPGAFDE
jgi:hypothetical protein